MLFVMHDIVHYMKWDSGGNYNQQLDVYDDNIMYQAIQILGDINVHVYIDH